jgi:predicted NAD/FAD-binding protein
LLQLTSRPQWMTVAGHSRSYVSKLMWPLRARVFTNSPVCQVRRFDGGVRLGFDDRESVDYDHVVLACHANQSLHMLADPDRYEREILRAFPYQPNVAVLHTDDSVLPKRRHAWASWNYHVPSEAADRVSVTYDLNRLQSLELPGPLCLTLNPNSLIDESKVLKRFEFSHPTFTSESLAAQRRFSEINGRREVSFCGAYWGYGFHEDGVNSALAVTRPFGLDLESLAMKRSTVAAGSTEQLAEV